MVRAVLFLEEEREDLNRESAEESRSLHRESPPLETKGGAPSSPISGASPIELLIFGVDVEDGAVFVEGHVEGFGFFDEDVGELIFLG